MYKILDIENWSRKEHYHFFKNFDEPFFGISTELDCTNAYNYCKQNSYSFFLYYHFIANRAVNMIDEFRHRIKDDKILTFNTIHVTTTILRDDKTFGFSLFPQTKTFEEFSKLAEIEISSIKNKTGLNLTEDSNRLDVIHYTTVPWIKFTGVTHPRNFNDNLSIPKIAFGKYFNRNKKVYIPIAVNVHHALMDGYHVGKYLELLQELLNIN